MRKMSVVKVLVVLVLCVVGVGFYRGWLVLSGRRAGVGDNKVDVNLTADPDKVKEDVHIVEAKLRGLTGNPADGTPHTPSKDGVTEPSK